MQIQANDGSVKAMVEGTLHRVYHDDLSAVHMVHDTSKLDPLVAEYEKRKQALTGAHCCALKDASPLAGIAAITAIVLDHAHVLDMGKWTAVASQAQQAAPRHEHLTCPWVLA
jgi:hypothetical protein